MPDESEKDLRDVVSRIERELVHVKNALVLLGVQPCQRCQRFFRRADHAALLDCGDLVCYECIHEWWPHRCEELSVEDREAIERKLKRWLVAHHGGQVIHDLRKLPDSQLVELKIATTCEDCHGTGVQGHERCPRCDGGSIWVVVLKRGANPDAGPG
jgi:hypothetical protein